MKMPKPIRDVPIEHPMRRSLVVFVLLFSQASVSASDSDKWIAPIGIPVPEFGIEESHLMYADDADYYDAGNGPYSIYVDNTAANCSNWGPGTAAKPRCEIPLDLSDPGTIVEIHGGPYKYNSSKPRIEANGSEQRPVFIRGVDDGKGFPVIDSADVMYLLGQYFVVENLIFLKTAVSIGTRDVPPSEQHHVSLRNVEISRHPRKNGSAIRGTNIVFYKNHVHHNQGDDRHGTTVTPGANRIWIVDNYFHHNGGDAVQFCHGCKENPPRNIFIGRNLMHSDRENGVDLKYGKDIVVSENTIFGYRPSRPDQRWCYDDDSYCGIFSSGSDGSAIVIGSDGAPGRPWIIANNIYDSAQGIRIEEVRDTWIIGNNIHNITHNAIALEKWGESVFIIGNRIHEAEFGINQYWRDKFGLFVSSNVFSNMNGEFLDVRSRVASMSELENNLFWNGDEAVRFRWGRRYKENPSDSPVEFAVGDGINFVADPQLSRYASDRFELIDGQRSFAWLRQELEVHEAKFQSIYSENVSIIQAER